MQHADHVTKDEFQEGMRNLRDDIFNRLDDISSKLEAMQEDQTLKFHQDMEVKEKVDNQEKRISALEDQKN